MLRYFLLLLLLTTEVHAQPFTYADTLRGTNGPFRKQWDVLHYDITIEPNLQTQTLIGKNIITFFDEGVKVMQIDLQSGMQLDSAYNKEAKLSFRRDGDVYWVILRDTNAYYRIKPDTNSITLWFTGNPKRAISPPWEGGWIWTNDSIGRPWATVVCQGLGASVWLPCKDWQGDKPDMGMTLNVIVPDTLMGIGNGRLISQERLPENRIQFKWQVVNPINAYNINVAIGAYMHLHNTIQGEKGNLDLDYYILDYHRELAIKQFVEVPRTLHAFEYWFGAYPFYEDSYKLTEAPYPGMEHQSDIAYGNNFQNGYLGKDLSETGEGLKWDFIIVHESGHEWFGNSITAQDIADMWIHEGFTHYGESLFTDYYFGQHAGKIYSRGTRINIKNDKPIIGNYGVNNKGSSDMYYKAGAMIHMIRQCMQNEEGFKQMLRKMNKTYYHKIVTTDSILRFMEKETNLKLDKIFEQYLQTTQIPELSWYINNKKLFFTWKSCVPQFDLPVELLLSNNKSTFIYPKEGIWNSIPYKKKNIRVSADFYITNKKEK